MNSSIDNKTARFKCCPAKEFERLVSPHLEALFRLAYRWTGRKDLAEDLIQDVLLKLFPRCSTLQELDQVYPWIAKVMYRIYVDDYRRKLRSPVRLVDERKSGPGPDDYFDQVASQDPGPEAEYDRRIKRDKLLDALSALTEAHQMIITLRDVEGYSLEETAAILDLPLGTVKSQLHRGRAALRERLQMEPSDASDRVKNTRRL